MLCLLSQWMSKLKPRAEKALVQVTSWEELMAQLGGCLSGPDLCHLCLSTPLCMKGAGRSRKRGGAPPALDLGARLSKKQTVWLGDALPPSFFLWQL